MSDESLDSVARRSGRFALAATVALGLLCLPVAPADAKGGNGGSSGDRGDRGNSGDRGKSGDRGNSASAGERGNSGHSGSRGASSSARDTQSSARGNGNGNGNAGATARGNSGSTGPTRLTTSGRPVTRSATTDLLHPSQLGALNAANASPNALMNAAPGSRVGLIAAYRDAVLTSREVSEDLTEAVALLDGLEEPDRTVDEIERNMERLRGRVAVTETELSVLRGQLEDAGGSDATLEQQIADAEKLLDRQVNRLAGLNTELETAETYEETVDLVKELEDRLLESVDTEASTLEAASNKPVVDGTAETVQYLLGIAETETAD